MPPTFETLLKIVRRPLTEMDANFRSPIFEEERLALTLQLSVMTTVGVFSQSLTALEFRRSISSWSELSILSRCLVTGKGFQEPWNFSTVLYCRYRKEARPLSNGLQFCKIWRGFSASFFSLLSWIMSATLQWSASETADLRMRVWLSEFQSFSKEQSRPAASRLQIPWDHFLAETFQINWRFSSTNSAEREVVENASGVLTQKWTIFKRSIKMSPANVARLVKVAYSLDLRANAWSKWWSHMDRSRGSGGRRNLNGYRENVARSAKHFAKFLCLPKEMCRGKWEAFTESHVFLVF